MMLGAYNSHVSAVDPTGLVAGTAGELSGAIGRSSRLGSRRTKQIIRAQKVVGSKIVESPST